MTKNILRSLTLLAAVLAVLSLFIEPVNAQTPQQSPTSSPTLPSERPERFEPTNDGFEYVRRDVMIPMRDGVKLHTVILVPRGAKSAPILLTLSPYETPSP